MHLSEDNVVCSQFYFWYTPLLWLVRLLLTLSHVYELALPQRTTWHALLSTRPTVLEQGWKRPLQWEDFFALPYNLETNQVYPAFESEWRRLLQAAESTPKVAHLVALGPFG